MNYAKDLLGDDGNVILDLLTIIWQKCNYGDKIDKLSYAEKVIYLVGDVETEVNNGGFSQYLYNSSGKYAKEAVEALKTIGANHTAALLEDAIEIYKNGPTNDGRNNPEVDLTDEQEEKLNELDNRFYEYKDDLYALQLKFIKKNINEFRLIDKIK